MTSRRKRKKLDSPPAVRWNRNLDKRYARDPFYSGTGWPPPIKYLKCRICRGAPHHTPVFKF